MADAIESMLPDDRGGLTLTLASRRGEQMMRDLPRLSLWPRRAGELCPPRLLRRPDESELLAKTVCCCHCEGHSPFTLTLILSRRGRGKKAR